MNKAAQHGAILVVAYIAMSFLNYAFGVALSWFFSPAQFGVLGVAQSLLLLTSLIVGSGFAWTAARDVAASEVNDETRRHFRAAWIANTVGGALFSGGLWVAYEVGWLPFGPAYRLVIPLVALTTTLLAARAVINGAARGLYRFGPVAINLVGEVVIKVAAGLTLVALGAGVAGVMLGFALGALVSLVHSLSIIKPVRLWRGQGWFDRQVMTATLPIFVGMLGPALMLNLDILGLKLLSPMGQGDQLAGLYQAAVVLARTPVFMAQALILVLFSYVAGARHPAQSDRRDAPGYIQTALRAWGMVLLPGGLVLVLAPHAALALFFPAYYQAAALALQIASIGGILLALITLLNGVFQAAGDHRRPAISALLAMITQVMILVWLVPRWGTMAAALSLLVAGVVALIVVLPAFKLHLTPGPLDGWRDVQSNLTRVGVPLVALIAPLVLLPDGGRGLALLKLGSAGLLYLVALVGVHFRSVGGMSGLLVRLPTHSKNGDGKIVTMDTRLYAKPADQRLSRSPSVYVVIPTFNEADNLPPLLAELFALPIPNLYAVVVDDNSPDGTGQVAEELRLRYRPRLDVIHRPGKGGLGPAYRQGFQHALELGADYIVQMDADFSHSPAFIPQFLKHSGHHDVIVGSRYMDGSQIDARWSWWRYALSLWANSVYVRLILGLTVGDATGGFKLWSRQALSMLMSFPVTSTGYVFQVEMAYLAQKLGLRVLEVPIYFADRRVGLSKMSSSIKLEAVWRTWYLRWRYRAVRSAHGALPHDTQPIAGITR